MGSVSWATLYISCIHDYYDFNCYVYNCYVYSDNLKCYLYQNDFLTGKWESQHSGNSSTVMTAYTKSEETAYTDVGNHYLYREL